MYPKIYYFPPFQKRIPSMLTYSYHGIPMSGNMYSLYFQNNICTLLEFWNLSYSHKLRILVFRICKKYRS